MEVNADKEVRDHPSKIKNMHWDCLKSQMSRLRTYSGFPKNANKSAILLAEGGFAYNGSGKDGDDLVICCFCCVQKKGWLPTDDIMEVHRKLSPDCSIVTARDCHNIPLYTHNNFEALLEQLKNLHITGNRCHNIGNRHSALYSDSENTTETTQSTPSSSQNPAGSSRNAPGSAQMSTRTTTAAATGNAPTGKELGIITDFPKSPEYAAEETRLATFKTWPRDHHMKKEHLVDAGFFYARGEYRDRVRCFYCNGHVQRWTKEADVWVEHARWFPQCPYVRLKRGQRFVNAVQALHRSNIKITSEILEKCLRDNSPASTNIESAADTHATIASSGLGNETRTSKNIPGSSQTQPEPARHKSNSSMAPLTGSAHNNPDGTQTTISKASTSITSRSPPGGEHEQMTEHPQHVKYTNKNTRLDTFDSWPKDRRFGGEDLAGVGFYYAASSLSADTFLKQRQKDNQPRGDNASLATRTHQIQTDLPGNRFELDPLRQDPALLALKSLGYSEDDIVTAAKKMRLAGGFLSSDELLEKLKKDGKPRENNTVQDSRVAQNYVAPQCNKRIAELKKENARLRLQFTCMVCRNKEIAVVFLPCGHLVCCTDCATGPRDCPRCHKKIDSTSRAFFKLTQCF